MDEFIWFFVLTLGVWFLNKKFSQNLFAFWFLISSSKKWAINFTAFFLLPGTIVHELSHFLAAIFLAVPTGDFSFWPEQTEEGIRMGSVKIGKCDFVRRNLIGIAPFISGSVILYFLTMNLPKDWEILFTKNWGEILIYFLIILGILTIANTMFSSKKDLEVILPLVITVLIIVGLFWWFEVKISDKILDFGNNLSFSLNQAFLITILVDVGFIVLTKILMYLTQKLLKRRVILVKD